MLLFDEMEDLLGGDELMWSSGPGKLRAGGSKVFLNRVLEETPVPVLWTTNAADHTSAAILRRMIYALEMPRPGATRPNSHLVSTSGSIRNPRCAGRDPLVGQRLRDHTCGSSCRRSRRSSSGTR